MPPFTGSRYAFSHISSLSRRFASGISATIPIRRQLEVERKFLATPSAVSYLRSSGSQFKKHESLGKKTTHDVYYDRNELLFSKGVYIRRRNGNWEAKIRSGGDFINSAFTEVDGIIEVKDAIKQYLNISTDGLSIEKMLQPCAEFVSQRESWMIDGRFKVDVDATDFGHIVGEVELTSELKLSNSTHAQEEEEKAKLLREKMDQDIQEFMQLYPEAFPVGRPLGKLSAYFLWLKQIKT